MNSIIEHEKPTVRDDKPDNVTLHTGKNDLRIKKTASQIARSFAELAMSEKDNRKSVIVSGIASRNDTLNNKATEFNNRLLLMCKERKVTFITHSGNIDSTKHLNERKLHLNHNGIKVSAENFSIFSKKLN